MKSFLVVSLWSGDQVYQSRECPFVVEELECLFVLSRIGKEECSCDVKYACFIFLFNCQSPSFREIASSSPAEDSVRIVDGHSRRVQKIKVRSIIDRHIAGGRVLIAQNLAAPGQSEDSNEYMCSFAYLGSWW